MGGKEVEVTKTGGLNLREKAARATLRETRRQGHVYVELRQVGKRHIFFCTLCQAQCFNDSVLSDHLNGKFHARRYAAAKVTLFGPNPWPFSDGVLFFNSFGEVSKRNGQGNYLVIHGVLVEGEVENMRVRFTGYGHIGARVHDTIDGRQNIRRIWCSWLGKGDTDDCKELISSPKCDFAVVTFSYTYGLGRNATSYELEAHVSPGSLFEIDGLGHPKKKRRKSFSDPEDSTDSQFGYASRLISSRSARKELRKQMLLTAERTCAICGQPTLLGKDVSTLLNCKTGRLACSRRNKNGAFHLFHTSCLIHWILMYEFETWSILSSHVKTTTQGRKAKHAQKKHISMFCPECHGTGLHIDGDELEKPPVSLSEMFLRKLKLIEAHKAWMKNPEDLKKCSTGLHFPSDSSERLHIQEKAMPLKLVNFYRADASI